MSPRLSIIPAGAVTDPSLEPRDLQVLCLLGRHTDKDSGWCRRSQVKMAKEISCGRATLQRSLERLVDAGYVQKKQWNVAEGAEHVQPSASYLYRVILDRDDGDTADRADSDEDEPTASHAPDASEMGEGVPAGGHPRARPDGHPVPTHARAPRTSPSNDKIERDARASHEKTAKFIVAFEARWPTSIADSAQRTAYAAAELSEAEQDAALAGIGPFFEELKKLGRKHKPAGFTYLEEKRWTKLAAPEPARRGGYHEDGSVEMKAIAAAYEIAGVGGYFRSVMKRPGVPLFYAHVVDARLLALANMPGADDWPVVDHRQAAAWEEFLRAYVTVQSRRRFVEGLRAPWAWPPSIEGKIYDITGSPSVPELSDDDADALAKEGVR